VPLTAEEHREMTAVQEDLSPAEIGRALRILHEAGAKDITTTVLAAELRRVRGEMLDDTAHEQKAVRGLCARLNERAKGRLGAYATKPAARGLPTVWQHPEWEDRNVGL
jgi:hypothetical protein